jgi:putative membrane protein
VINGALTARVGLAAIDVCRPIPFAPGKRASASAVVARALKGLFGSSKT